MGEGVGPPQETIIAINKPNTSLDPRLRPFLVCISQSKVAQETHIAIKQKSRTV